MVGRTCIFRFALPVVVVCWLAIPDAVAKKEWHLLPPSAISESEITNNYVSRAESTKDSAMVSYRHVQDFRKNQLSELQAKIQEQLPQESKFFDEFEGSEFN